VPHSLEWDSFSRRTLTSFLAIGLLPLTLHAANLSVNASAAYTGNYGLQVVLDDTSAAWVGDDSPAALKRYRVRFYVRLNGLVESVGSEFTLLSALSGPSVEQLRLMIGESANGKHLRLAARRDDGSFAETPAGGEMRLATGWRALEIDWRAAGAPGVNDGSLAVWVDGQGFPGLGGLDNDLGEVSSVRWGAVAGLDAGTTGSFRLDDFESRRDLRVGLLSVFGDVPAGDTYWRHIHALYNAGVTGGCGGGNYCPASPVTREQMSVFLLVSREGAEYQPAACSAPPFADVPVSSGYCRWIRELAARSVTGGCGGGNYCASSAVTRAQMAVFLLVTLEGSGYSPAACTSAPFADVPTSSPYCRWIRELAARGVTGGCGGGNYCPDSAVTRGQMSVFLATTFGLPVPVP
jgi:hypothetical protein